MSDRLRLGRDHIEAVLAEQEREAYGLKEKILLYDLTKSLSGRIREANK